MSIHLLDENDRISNAVKEVWRMVNVNKWPLHFCVSKISNWHKIDYELLMSRCIRKKQPMTIQGKKYDKQKLPASHNPWWIRY